MATETRPASAVARTTRDGDIVFFDGAFMPLGAATVSIATHALHYGTAVFEGIRAYWNEDREELYLLKLREHVDRFFHSCRLLHIDLPFSRPEMAEIVVELLRRNGYDSDVYVRPIAFKATQTIKLTLGSLDSSVAVLAFPFGKYVHREGGLQVGISSWSRIGDNAIPTRAKVSGSYVNAALASDDAARRGYDEAIMLNANGMLSEASSANIFLLRGGRLVTPALSENILEGITRAAVIELAREELGLPVEERAVGRSELYVAEEIFLTGTGVQIEPVVGVDRRPVGSGFPGPVTTRLQAIYAAAVRNRLLAYADWCTPVYGGVHVAGD